MEKNYNSYQACQTNVTPELRGELGLIHEIPTGLKTHYVN